MKKNSRKLKSVLVISALCFPVFSNAMMAKARRKWEAYFGSRRQHQLLEESVEVKVAKEQYEWLIKPMLKSEEEKEQSERPIRPMLRVELYKKEDDGFQETIIFSAASRTIYGDKSIDAVYTVAIEGEYEKRKYVATLSYIIGVKQYGNILIGHSSRGARPMLNAECHENKQNEQAKHNSYDDRTVVQKVEAALVRYKNEIELL